MDPQFLPCAAHVVGVHVFVTQTLLVQVWLVLQVPQLSVPLQPSGMDPQFLPCAAHVVGVQPPVWQVPLTQVCPVGQVHVMVPPQPSDTLPQALPTPPDPQLFGTQVGWHVPLLAALQVCPETHEQLRVPPQPLGMLPQLSPWLPAGHAFTVQPHWFGVPPPPHVCGAVQVPQLIVPPCPSEMVPQLALAEAQVTGGGPPTTQASGFAGGLGVLHAECQCSSATHDESQVAPLPADVQQWVVPE
jgi:hypothetical protein